MKYESFENLIDIIYYIRNIEILFGESLGGIERFVDGFLGLG